MSLATYILLGIILFIPVSLLLLYYFLPGPWALIGMFLDGLGIGGLGNLLKGLGNLGGAFKGIGGAFKGIGKVSVPKPKIKF